jgi:hypothetical protein
MTIRALLLIAVAAAAAAVVDGCGNAAPSKAPPITGKPRKHWKDMSQDEKIASLEHSPAPNRDQLIELVKQGKY